MVRLSNNQTIFWDMVFSKIWGHLHCAKRETLKADGFLLVYRDANALLKVLVAQSCLTHGLEPPTRLVNSPGQNTGVGCQSLLQGIFPTHGSNRGFPRCRRIPHPLSHQGSFLNHGFLWIPKLDFSIQGSFRNIYTMQWYKRVREKSQGKK